MAARAGVACNAFLLPQTLIMTTTTTTAKAVSTNVVSLPSGGNCFFIHGSFVVSELGGYEDDLRLCHGVAIGRGPLDNIPHWHCWLEKNGIAYDNSNGSNVAMPIELYYSVGNINAEYVHKYTRQQARDKMLETEHYGPWDPPQYAVMLYQQHDLSKDCPEGFDTVDSFYNHFRGWFSHIETNGDWFEITADDGEWRVAEYRVV